MTFEQFINKVAEFEGFRSEPYDDLQPNVKIKSYCEIKGTLTIGYGRTENVKIGDTTTKAKEKIYLEKRLLDLYEQVKVNSKLYGYNFSTNQLLSLTDFTYNAGSGNYLKLIDYGRRSEREIAQAFSLYIYSKGRPLEGLKKRRQFEQDLFLSAEHKAELEEDKYNLTFELQAFCNHVIKQYELPVEKIITDGIYGSKTDKCLNDILKFIK